MRTLLFATLLIVTLILSGCGDNKAPGKPEKVPSKYLSFATTDLICDVQKGKNVFDIPLTTPPAGSKPPPQQPQQSRSAKKPGAPSTKPR